MTPLQRRSRASRKGWTNRRLMAGTRPEMPTEQQHIVLKLIQRHVADRGLSPTMKEIGQALGYKSNSGVLRIAYELERKGYLERRRLGWRAFEPVQIIPKISHAHETRDTFLIAGLLAEAA